MDFVDIILFFVTFLLIIIIIISWKYNYWKERKVPYVTPVFPFGSLQDVFLGRKTFTEMYSEFYYKFNKYKYFGIFLWRHPVLFIRDPEIIKLILVKNFNNFRDNTIQINEQADSFFAKNPFTLNGDRWRLVRSQLTPAFTAGKIKSMFPLMNEVTKRMITYINQNITTFKNGVDAKDIARKYTTDTFALCGLSVNAHSFDNTNADFKVISKKIFENEDLSALITFVLMFIDPELAQILRCKVLNNSVSKFFRDLVKDIMTHRKNNNVDNNDYFEFLCRLKEKTTEYEFDEEHIAAHIVTFFLNAVETSAMTMMFLLYELSTHPEIFKKLRQEIDFILEKHEGILTYDAVQEMEYLDCCLSEALRKDTPVLWLMRKCTKPFKFPSSTENNFTEFTLDEGVSVLIPAFILHHDPKYYPNPNEYFPERFFYSNAKQIFLPFGDGPRLCLGTKYATAQIKAACVAVVQNFDITVSEKTINPPVPEGPSFLFALNYPLFINLYPRGEIYKN